jgi:two-component system, NarL family, response regulator LiaR
MITLVLASAPHEGASGRRDAGLSTRVRVLVAEDNRLMRRLLVYHLSHAAGFEVVGEAEDGRSAVELALHLRPDAVLMDLNMPGLNGIQATERILAQHPHIRVVLLTDLDALAGMGRFSGAAACLDKGCTPDEIIATLRRTLAAGPALGLPARADENRLAVEHLAMRYGLTGREKAVFASYVSTDHSLKEIAQELSLQLGEPVTLPAVKHTLDRVMTKLRLEPRTRAALVKRVAQEDRSR